MRKNQLSEDDRKRRIEIVDFGLQLIRFWLDNPDKDITWILIKLDEKLNEKNPS